MKYVVLHVKGNDFNHIDVRGPFNMDWVAQRHIKKLLDHFPEERFIIKTILPENYPLQLANTNSVDYDMKGNNEPLPKELT